MLFISICQSLFTLSTLPCDTLYVSLTVERDAAVRVSQGVLGHTFVLHEVDPDQISNAQLHVNFIATHNSKGLVFCV